MSNVLQDADHLQMTYQMLLTNQSQASVWIGRVLDSVMEMITKVSLSSWLMMADNVISYKLDRVVFVSCIVLIIHTSPSRVIPKHHCVTCLKFSIVHSADKGSAPLPGDGVICFTRLWRHSLSLVKNFWDPSSGSYPPRASRSRCGGQWSAKTAPLWRKLFWWTGCLWFKRYTTKLHVKSFFPPRWHVLVQIFKKYEWFYDSLISKTTGTESLPESLNL